MRRMASLLLVLMVFVWSCDFDSAFRQYCDESGNCPDAASPPDTRTVADVPSEPDLPPSPGDTAPPIRLPQPCGAGLHYCGPNELCHPLNQICMQKCIGDGDCPRELGLDRCDEVRVPGGPEHVKVCKCSSWQACDKVASGFICSNEDRLCEPRCGETADCENFALPRVCEPVSGECKRPCKDKWDCYDPEFPRCDQDTRLCKPCIDVYDCYGRPDGKSQCVSGTCV